MSNVATFRAFNMSREEILEESAKMLPILKEINDREDTVWQQEKYLEYTAVQQNESGLSKLILAWGAPIVVGVTIGGGIGSFLNQRISFLQGTAGHILWFLLVVIAFIIARKILVSRSDSIHGEAGNRQMIQTANQEITRLHNEVNSLRAQHMGWMTQIFPEDMLFYDAVSYIHNAFRLGMVDTFKEAINSYMTHLHRTRVEFEATRGANAQERAAAAAEETAYQVRQLRFEEAWRDFL